ncbi:MAG: porin family protein [Rhodospirillaceae bacterium]|nr:MAG: porin family protein [Rhodospirillaceae bacterium]
MSARSVMQAVGCAILATVAILPADQAVAADNGIYGRLDVGAAISAGTGGDIFNGTGFGNDFGKTAAFDLGIGATIPVGLNGVDFRGDFTVGYLPSFNGDHSAPNASGATILSTQTNVRTWTAMINAYADIPTGTSITPYVGIGVGGAFNHLGLLAYNFNGTPGATEPGADTTSFAWSGMVGLGYKLSGSATLDLGYRYLDAGDVASSGTVTLANGVTSTQAPVRSRLSAHELTVGVRLDF